jgi:hypothetical protein
MCDNRLYLLLLYATMPVLGDNATSYPSLTVASVEACDAKKSSKARRVIMPRLALRPVWALEPIEVAIQLGHQGEREPHVDHGRRGAFRTAYRQRGGGLASGQLLPSWAAASRTRRLHGHVVSLHT